MSYLTLETVKLIIEFERQLNDIIFTESLDGEADRQQAAETLKGYFSEIKALVNDEKEIEIKQKL